MNDYKEWLDKNENNKSTKKKSAKIHPYIVTSVTLKEMILNNLNKFRKKPEKTYKEMDETYKLEKK